jgi:hypothetical protein
MMSRSHDAELPNRRRQLPSCYFYSSFIRRDFTLWTNITILFFCKQFCSYLLDIQRLQSVSPRYTFQSFIFFLNGHQRGKGFCYHYTARPQNPDVGGAEIAVWSGMKTLTLKLKGQKLHLHISAFLTNPGNQCCLFQFLTRFLHLNDFWFREI